MLVLGVSQLFAQQRIGYAEPQRILDSIPEREQVETQLEAFYNEWEQDYNQMYERYSEELFLFEESRNQLSSAQVRQEEARLSQMVEELTLMQQEFGVMFEERRAELLIPIVERINRAIEAVAEERGLDYVFQSETSNAEPIFFIIRDNPHSVNITDEVIARMNR
ncbi:periplasmic chaperone for outer membrane proteins Skp [Cyclonatronum proteinivorum]|uniref:Periplasmic chaperone for outer membrane proteins Skp n=2 Tax=Cyclonatronum proteinivorum TaxID=1457365 RepID=A0A345UMS5_9BACT|nr:periplasmic chaperone for outer membrane proteins Skp [Cyclonatronum proteinivorum]